MEEKKTKKNKKALKVILIIFGIYVLLMGIIFGVASHYMNKINRFGEIDKLPRDQEYFETDDGDGTQMNPGDIIWDPGMDIMDEDLVNILLVGQDRRPGQGRQRSDSMILCSYNPENNQLSMISFLRDLYVQIPGYSDNRLNSAYVFGGFPLLKETLYLNFGVTVDGCFEVDFNGFTGVIDSIGGVDISLSEAEAAIVGGGATAGMNHLNGEQALTYARIRYIDSDFNRTARQRNVINSAIGKLRNCSVKQLMSLLDTVLPLITTDMSNMDITSLALRYAPSLPSIQVSSHYVPGEGCYQYAKIRGMSVLVPDLKKVRTALREQYLPF